MNKDELIAAIKDGQNRLYHAVQDLDQKSLDEPGVSGDWSVKDILAHISRWEAELIAMLFEVQRGLTPTTAQFSKMSTDELNEKWHTESKSRSLAQVQTDLEGVHRQILRRVDELSDRDLDDTTRYSWLKGTSLGDYIANDTFEHELDHAEEIREWKQKRIAHPKAT